MTSPEQRSIEIPSLRQLVPMEAKMKRRDFFKQAGIGSATLVSLPALAHALTLPESARSPLEPRELPANPFSILLHGTYKPVMRCPDLGLVVVDPVTVRTAQQRSIPSAGFRSDRATSSIMAIARPISIAKRQTPSATFTWRLVACHPLPTTSREAR